MQNEPSHEKTAFCICENKGAYQLHGHGAADQSLYFSLHRQYNISSFYIRNFKPLAIFCGCTAWFVSDPVENLKERFSCDAAKKLTLSGVGDGDGVNVDVVLPLEDVFLLRDDLMGMT